MNKAQIIEMAEAVGFTVFADSQLLNPEIFDHRIAVEEYSVGDALARFAQLAADHTRNEIAQENERQYLKGFKAGKEFALEEAAALCERFAERQMNAAECAAAIRAMKGKP
jgi:hypothetical protein